LIAGPCVIESYDVTATIAAYLKELTRRLSIPLIFKASYDKATAPPSIHFVVRISKGLDILAHQNRVRIAVLSDVHHIDEPNAQPTSSM
jgi:2-dehydro-3-deoxyphosphooctonate aldolase (KDO 8-P synthase)